MIPINPKSGVPLWEQIREGIKNEILLGVWSPGSQLPSVRALALELKINPNTIQRAMAELEREGLTYTVAGKGAFVEEDVALISLKRDRELLLKLDRTLSELKKAGIDLVTVKDRAQKIYKEENDD